jgi:hypothetical protein
MEGVSASPRVCSRPAGGRHPVTVVNPADAPIRGPRHCGPVTSDRLPACHCRSGCRAARMFAATPTQALFGVISGSACSVMADTLRLSADAVMWMHGWLARRLAHHLFEREADRAPYIAYVFAARCCLPAAATKSELSWVSFKSPLT